MNVIISQPMKGLTEDQIRKNRAEAVTMLESEGHTVIDTIFADTPPESAEQALWYLGKTLQAIASVDAVYFMDGWREARGCRLEYEACKAYGIATMMTPHKKEEINIYDFLANTAKNFLRENENGEKCLPLCVDSLSVDVTVDELGNISKEETGIHIYARIIPYRTA